MRTNASGDSTVQEETRLRSTRRRRIAIELLLPPGVATALVALVGTLRDPRAALEPKALGGLLVILLFAYLLTSIPSALFTIVMEVAFAKGLSPESGAAVGLAAGLGLLCGAALVGFNPSYGAFSGMVILGGITGAIIGLLVRAGARRARRATAGAELDT